MADQWKNLRKSDECELGLWELPSDILTYIQEACSQAWTEWTEEKSRRCRKGKGKRNGNEPHAPNSVDKFRITKEQVRSILWERKHPGGLIRRTDFVPFETFHKLITHDRLQQAVFDTDEVSWLTKSVDLPPVQPWPNVHDKKFDFKSLLCLFARLMKDECFASIRYGPIVSIHEARLDAKGILRILDPCAHSKASVHKGRLVWIAENNKLKDDLSAAWDEYEGKWIAPFGLQAFCDNFTIGSLHVVEGMDVTNSKMQLRPSLRPEGAEYAQEQPDDESMSRPGVEHGAAHIETRSMHAPVVYSSIGYLLFSNGFTNKYKLHAMPW
jgi:hypothetical protein